MKRMTLLSKVLIVVAVLGGGFGLLKLAQSQGWTDSLAPGGNTGGDVPSGLFTSKSSNSSNRPLRVGVVTWGGYAGGQYFNRGFKPNSDSQYQARYGLSVEFVLMDDYLASREAFKAGELDLLWGTVDSFPAEVDGLSKQGVKILFQADWSRGGDAVVANRRVQDVNDLRGKKIAVAFGTPSHTFLFWLLEAAGLKQSDVQIVEVQNAIDAAAAFKAQSVDAAVVWSPDDEDCVKSVKGARVLKSTKDASHIIADVFYVKDSFLQANHERLKQLVEGWMLGAAELNSSEAARQVAARILADGLGQPESFTLNAINNVRLTTYGDNVNFFNLHGNYSGVKGEDIYTNMARAYNAIGLAPPAVPAWRTVIDTSVVRDINLTGEMHASENSVKFDAPTEADKTAVAFSTKQISIRFASGSSELDENAKLIIDMGFANVAKSFAKSRIRVEGNTDSHGSDTMNRRLSERRAKAVADYLVEEYGFDPNRFVVVGNGEDNPVDTNSTSEGRARNRRTDFQLISQE